MFVVRSDSPEIFLYGVCFLLWIFSRSMAKPNKKGPVTTIDIFCGQCKTKLFRYRKGGKGALVKCFKERITEDFTEQPCICPGCQRLFARDVLVRGTPAYKFIGGKVTAR